MTAPLHTFAQALQIPYEAFDRLREAEVICDASGIPLLHRTTSYVEAEIRWQGAAYLLMMPLSSCIRHRMEHRLHRLMHLAGNQLASLQLLDDELRWFDAQGIERHTDLLLHALSGVSFDEGCALLGTTRAIEALDRFETALHSIGLCHNNLTRSNLRFVDDCLVALRPFAATFDGSFATDHKALEMLRQELREAACCAPSLEDCSVDYTTPQRLSGHRFVGNEFEGLYCVEEEQGYGYVDAQNHFVITPQFLWADDFHENRAVVETIDGMGVIDRKGTYILPPRFEMIEYLYEQSLFKTYAAGQWHYFDYCGSRIEDSANIHDTTIYTQYGKDQNTHHR